MSELRGTGRIDRKETLRYLGYYGVEQTSEIQQELDECEKLLLPSLAPVACYGIYDIKFENGLDLGFCKTDSKSLERNLSGCKKIVLFAATVGAGVDRLILKYSKLCPSRALILQAMGSAAVECWCDDLNNEFSKQYGELKPRFSCGYGDLPVSLQRDIFNALNVTKRLGITLSDNFFMTPTKSVTAIIGIKNDS